MKKSTKPADRKSTRTYQEKFGERTPEVYESTLIDRVIN
jgi:hypothetical protein